MKKILLYIFFSIGWYHAAFGRSIVEGNDKCFLIAKNAVDTCNSQTFGIEKAGDVLRTVEPVLSENDFTYQWYKNGEKIVNATGTTLQTREAGYYTLKRISKTNTACVKTSDNFISVYSPDSGSPLWISVD